MGRHGNAALRRPARTRRGAALAGRGRQFALALSSAIVASLGIAGSAGAVVVDMNATGPAVSVSTPSVPYNQNDQSGYYGVAMIQPSPTSSVADPRGTLTSAQIPSVSTAGSCTDPWLASGFSPLAISAGNGLCAHQMPGSHWGSVLPQTETFALTWDPTRHYWGGTRNFLEGFLRHVANASGSQNSPYAVTPQYRGGSAKRNAAAYDSLYGGGCVDFGQIGGASCRFTNARTTSIGQNVATRGRDYPSSCPPPDDAQPCTVTDSDIRDEINATVNATGLNGHTAHGFTRRATPIRPPARRW